MVPTSDDTNTTTPTTINKIINYIIKTVLGQKIKELVFKFLKANFELLLEL